MKLLKAIYKFYIYNRLEKITKKQLKCTQVIDESLNGIDKVMDKEPLDINAPVSKQEQTFWDTFNLNIAIKTELEKKKESYYKKLLQLS